MEADQVTPGFPEAGWIPPRLAPSRARSDRTFDAAARRAGPSLAPWLQVLAAGLAVLFAYEALKVGLSAKSLDTIDIARAVAESLAVLLPVCVGLYALRREQTARFARLLVITGLGWAPSVLALSEASIPYSIGRLWAWGVMLGVVYLLLAFPVGRLETRADRLLLGGAVATVTLLYLPTAFFQPFPTPSPWTACGAAACPANAFVVDQTQPHLIGSFVDIRDAVSALIYAAAATIVALRWARGSRLARGVHGPVFALAVANLVVAAAFLVARHAAPTASATEVVGVAWLFATPALTLAFLAGLVRWRFVAVGAWRQLTPDAPRAAARGGVRDAIATAVRDPSLEIGYWAGPDRPWLDEDGHPFALPPSGSVRALTEISAGGEPLAILVHEDSYLSGPALREVVQGVGLMALANQRVEAETRAELRDLRQSRARIVGAIDRDRLRIERDLHDGAQQRLIALKVAADRGADAVTGDRDETAELFRRIGSEATAALDEVRALARGVYPPLLVDRGLVDALNDAARRSGLRATVRARAIGRYPQEIEAAVYFCCLEALQNAEKHASATTVSIELASNGTITFEVRDDGRGFDTATVRESAGLANIRDRVAAVGGSVRIESVIGAGTLVIGSVPMLSDHVPMEIERMVLRATDALEDALGIYRAVRTASGTIVDFAVEHVNDAACAMDGLTREAQVGKTLGQLRPAYARSALFRWHCRATESRQPLVREDVEYIGDFGARRMHLAHETRAVALGAGRIALLRRDITDRKRAERDLEVRAEALAGEGAGVWVVCAASGVIVYANREIERMLGFGVGELEGRRATDFDITDPFASPSANGTGTPSDAIFDIQCRRRDGSLIWCEVVLDGFDDADLGWCWVAVHRDVTASREQQKAVDASGEQLQRALRGLPALAYSTDRELHPTLLFDNLVDPSDQARSGGLTELFGNELGEHVAEVNRRVQVTRLAAQVEVDVNLDGSARVVLNVDPVLTTDGAVAGLVGTVLRR
jgi:PAS domain S-box-containing protein